MNDIYGYVGDGHSVYFAVYSFVNVSHHSDAESNGSHQRNHVIEGHGRVFGTRIIVRLASSMLFFR